MAYLSINEKAFSELKEAAKKKAKDNDNENGYVFSDLSMVDIETEFDKDTGELNVFGSLMSDKIDFGWVDIKTVINMDLAIEIIEFYMKKLGKLKTILEAAK